MYTYIHTNIHTYIYIPYNAEPYLSNDIYGGDAAGRLHREHEMVRLSPQLDLLSERVLLRVPDTFPIYRKSRIILVTYSMYIYLQTWKAMSTYTHTCST